MLTHLDHVIVAVHDLSTAGAAFAALLGRGPSWRGEHSGLGTANALFRLSNTYVELLAPAGSGDFGDALRARLDAEGEGLLGLAFRTADAAVCCETLRARGVDAGLPQPGSGRDIDSGAVRRWRRVLLPASDTRGLLLFTIEHEGPGDGLSLAPLQAPEAASVYGLDHVVVASGDLDATRRLYGETLGLRLALDRVFEERRLRLLFFRVGGVTVEVAQPLGVAGDGRDLFMGLSYQVPDADAAKARLAAAGFDVSEVRAGMKPGTRVCSVRGRPLGVDTLLIEPAARREAAVR
jgi:catechol 2,3-dioxygenase-like lactoylglutathione lyase family enzyme